MGAWEIARVVADYWRRRLRRLFTANYARFKQRFAAEFDHPKIQLPDPDRIHQINLAALEKLWPLLSRRD